MTLNTGDSMESRCWLPSKPCIGRVRRPFQPELVIRPRRFKPLSPLELLQAGFSERQNLFSRDATGPSRHPTEIDNAEKQQAESLAIIWAADRTNRRICRSFYRTDKTQRRSIGAV